MAGYKVWANTEILEAVDLNGYLMAQCVPRFPSTIARSTAIGTPATGQLSYVTDVGLQLFNGTVWVLVVAAVPSVPVYADATARDAAITTPTAGMLVLTGAALQVYAAGAWVSVGP